MIYPIQHIPDCIPLGIQTEKGVQEIGFDVKPWLDAWDGLELAVYPTRPGEDSAYPAADVELIGTVLYWYPNDVDTAIAGEGKVEIVGVTADKRKLSGATRTVVAPTSMTATQEPPDTIKPFYDSIIHAGHEAKVEAAKYAGEAAAHAQEASASAETAGTYLGNVDASAKSAAAAAQEAKQSETAAASSAESAEKAKAEAISNADDAEEAAQAAAASASSAASSAENAAESKAAASKSAAAAAQDSAKAAKIVEDVTGGMGGLFLVTVYTKDGVSYANRTYREITTAANSKNYTCLLVAGGAVYLHTGIVEHPKTGKYCHDFTGRTEYDAGVGMAWHVYVDQDGNVDITGHKIKVVNPHKLTLTGAVEATYDGSEEVNVDIPAGGTGAYIITATHDEEGRLYADKAASEVRAAVAAGEMCLLYIDDGRVFSYFGEVFESLAGGTTPTFNGAAVYDDTKKRISFPRMHIKENKNVVAVSSNFPLPDGPNMHLVSNEYGYPVWEEVNALPTPADTAATAYLRWDGSAWEAVTIAQLKADLGL